MDENINLLNNEGDYIPDTGQASREIPPKKKPRSRKRRNKTDAFTQRTDKILEKKGLDPNKFDEDAVKAARQKIYQEFIDEHIDELL